VRDVSVGYLFLNVAVSDDRSGDALMEEGGIQQKHPIFLLRFDLTAIDINNVRNKLEGIEGYSYGERNTRDDFGDSENALYIGKKEACIFEKSKQSKANSKCDDKPQLSFAFIFFYQARSDVAYKRHSEDQKKE
jgi:hypothetical protein